MSCFHHHKVSTIDEDDLYTTMTLAVKSGDDENKIPIPEKEPEFIFLKDGQFQTTNFYWLERKNGGQAKWKRLSKP